MYIIPIFCRIILTFGALCDNMITKPYENTVQGGILPVMIRKLSRNISVVLLAAVIFNAFSVYVLSAEPSYSDTPPAETIAHSLVLNGNIGIKFYLNIDDSIAENGDAYVLISSQDRKTEKIPVNNDAKKTVTINGEAVECFVFQYEVAVTQITSDVILRLCLSDGSTVYTDSYSVYDYALNILNGSYSDPNKPDELKELVRAMLNFGGYAQQYFSYSLSELANENLYDDAQDPVLNNETVIDPSEAYFLKSPDFPAGLEYLSSALKLDSDTGICFYLRLSDGYTISDYTFTYNSSTLMPIYDEKLDAYRVTIDGISAPELAQTRTLLIKDQNKSGYIVYSPLHYVDLVLSQSSDISLRNTVTALYIYYTAASRYFS